MLIERNKNNKIPVITANGINPIFVKANSFILNKHNVFDYDTLKSLWFKEFEATLEGQDHCEFICFDNPKKQLLFLIKFE